MLPCIGEIGVIGTGRPADCADHKANPIKAAPKSCHETYPFAPKVIWRLLVAHTVRRTQQNFDCLFEDRAGRGKQLTYRPANHELAGLRSGLCLQSGCCAKRNTPRNRRAFRPTPTVSRRFDAEDRSTQSAPFAPWSPCANVGVRRWHYRTATAHPKRSESTARCR